MQNINLKCINNNDCFVICNTKNCSYIPIMCNNYQCQCCQRHENCSTSIKWKKLNGMIENKLKKKQKQANEYIIQIELLYKKITKQIEQSSTDVRNIRAMIMLNKFQRQVWSKFKQNNIIELNGSLIHQLEVQLSNQPNVDSILNIQKQKLLINTQTQKLIQMLESLVRVDQKSNYYALFNIQSKITKDITTISNFFQKKIKSMELIYRASDNNFEAKKFWEKCNNKANTITLIKTQFGKIIGGYTPLTWKKNLSDNDGKYQTDQTGQSFIFSISEKQKLTLINGKYAKAIYHKSEFGPTFGDGHDIWIFDKANQNGEGFANIGISYNNQFLNCNQQSFEKFSGQSKGYRFRVEQWEVHKLEFE